MKYLVTWAWEMDGHAGASAIVLPTIKAVQDYMKQCLTDEEGNEIIDHTSTASGTGAVIMKQPERYSEKEKQAKYNDMIRAIDERIESLKAMNNEE